MAYRAIWRGLVTSFPLWPFAIGFCHICVRIQRPQLGELKQAAATSQPDLQSGRGVLLVTQICGAVLSFHQVGLVQFHAIFASYPLMLMTLGS